MIVVNDINAFIQCSVRNERCRWHLSRKLTFELAGDHVPQLLLRHNVDFSNSATIFNALTVRYQQPSRFDGCYITSDDAGNLIIMYHLRPGDDAHDIIRLLIDLSESLSD